jgi:hypothetical protein
MFCSLAVAAAVVLDAAVAVEPEECLRSLQGFCKEAHIL